MLPAAMAPGRVITLLHLSDLHFGRYHRFAADEGLGSLLDRLRDDLDKRRDRDGLRPDLLIVSGDLAEYGQKEEIERGFRFIEALARLLELPRRRVAVVPGNHDINWHKSRAYFEDCEGDGVPPVEPYFRKLVFYRQFFERFYEGEPGISFSEDEPWTLFEHPDLGVVVAGLNSVIAESHRAEDHHGFLGERQLRAFAEKLRPYKERGFLRVGVMHHDPFQRPNARTEQDFKDLGRLLRPSLNLMLHGDVHEERLQWLWRDVPVFGIGSAAVGVAQRVPEVPNEYQLLQIHTGGVRWGLRAYVPDQDRWVGSPRADAAGERWLLEEPVVFDQVQALAQPGGPPPATDLELVVESYRKAIARNQGMPTVFDLLGVNEAGESAGGLDFLRVFVPQDAKREVPPARVRRGMREGEELGLRAAEPGVAEGEPLLEENERFFFDLDRARPIDELLGSGLAPRLFLLGAPGAGKTALTRWLLLKLCIPGEGVPGLPEKLIPVRVEMRRFDEDHRRAAGEHSFFDHLDREHGERFLSLRGEALRALAREGRLLWIFDGLDEVIDEERRRRYAEMIAGLCDQHPECQVLVTSRPAGAEIARPLLESAGLTTYALQDFTEAQRDRFLDAWHALVFATDPAVGRHRRERMARALGNTASLADLCRSPLLCALLAYLNREEDLPERRHRLYQKILERMAEHWDANKGLPARPEAERFDLDSKLLFLRRLAWQMREDPQRGAGNAIEQGDLEAFAARFCEERWEQAPDAARRTAEALLRQLRERNYVLAFFGGTTYGFAHRTFLDYLAAVEAHERFRGRQWELEDLGKLFAARWREPAWEETLLLICGFLQETRTGDVVRALQEIPRVSLKATYLWIDKYVGFCIKALAELLRIDSGIPREFACAINDIIEFRIRLGLLDAYVLELAFERVTGRWPGIESLLVATDGAGASWVRRNEIIYSSLILGAGVKGRLRVVLAVIRNVHFPEYIIRVATSLGPWSVREIEELCASIEFRNEFVKSAVVRAIVLSRGVRWNGDEPPIVILSELMREGAPIVRAWAAEALLDIGRFSKESLAVLWELLQSEKDCHVLGLVAVDLAAHGYHDEVMPVLERCATRSEECMARLVWLSFENEVASQALSRVLGRLRSKTPPETFLYVVVWMARRGMLVSSRREIVERLRAIDVVRRLVLLMHMSTVLSLRDLVADEYVWMLASDEYVEYGDMIRSHASDYVRSMPVPQGGAALGRLLDRLMDLGGSECSASIAGDVFRMSLAGPVAERARRMLEKTARDGDCAEWVRLSAAQSLGVDDSVGLEAQCALAQSADSEMVRLAASAALADLETLNRLAERAEDSHCRASARDALELYGHLSFLLHVGRPRRARVLLHGRRVGRLEETSAGGGTRFTYAADHLAAADARPLAPNLPLRPEPYESDTLHPFFANLLPEGPLFDQTARRLGLRRTDRFGMLLKVGADVMGAVQVLPEEDA